MSRSFAIWLIALLAFNVLERLLRAAADGARSAACAKSAWVGGWVGGWASPTGSSESNGLPPLPQRDEDVRSITSPAQPSTPRPNEEDEQNDKRAVVSVSPVLPPHRTIPHRACILTRRRPPTYALTHPSTHACSFNGDIVGTKDYIVLKARIKHRESLMASFQQQTLGVWLVCTRGRRVCVCALLYCVCVCEGGGVFAVCVCVRALLCCVCLRGGRVCAACVCVCVHACCVFTRVVCSRVLCVHACKCMPACVRSRVRASERARVLACVLAPPPPPPLPSTARRPAQIS